MHGYLQTAGFSSVIDERKHRWFSIASVLFIGLVALLLRSWGAGWSLPYVDHPDEPAVVDVILRVTQGQLNTEHFFYPSLILYLQALVFKLHFWVGLYTGLYSAPLNLPESNHFYTTIPAAFVWARLFTALLCTGTVLALATWSARFVGTRAALVAGALLALSPWAIIHAHYITVDGPAGLFAMLALLAALPVLERGGWRDYLLAGALIGLATGTKYQNALVVVPLVLAHGFFWRGHLLRRGARLVGAGAAAAAVFLLTTPYIVLDFAGFLRDMETLFTSYDAGHGDVGRVWPVDAYLTFHWREGLGPLPFVLLPVGMVALWRRSPAQAIVLLSFPLLLILALLRMETHFYRNLLPAQAPLLLVAAVGAVAIWDHVRLYIPGRLHGVAAMLALLVLLVPSVVPAYRASARLAQPDARVVAQEWARRAYPGVQIAAELSHPLRWDGVAQSTYMHFLPLRSVEWYREQGYGLLLANAGRRGKDTWSDAYEPLLETGEVVYSVGGRFSDYLGPRIDIIDTGLTPATVPNPLPPTTLGSLRLLSAPFGRQIDDPTGPEVHPDAPLRPGDTLALTAFWTVDYAVPSGNYMLFVHLRTPDGQTLVQRDNPPWQGLFPPESWIPGDVATESLDLALPADLPPGEYRLVMGLYNPADWTRYPAMQSDERLPNNEIDLGEVKVEARSLPISLQLLTRM